MQCSIAQRRRRRTRKAYGTVSGTETLVSGIENTLAPATALALGRVPPHWYRTYVSLAYRLVTTYGTHGRSVRLYIDHVQLHRVGTRASLALLSLCSDHLICWEVLHFVVPGESDLQGRQQES
jgi:hypothetical protein